MPWNPTEDIETPVGLNKCKWCHTNCMEAEAVEDGFHTPSLGRLIRIFSACDASNEQEKDDIRTEFLPECHAIHEWNILNPPDFYSPVRNDGIISSVVLDGTPLSIIDVPIDGDEYRLCENARIWSSGKTTDYGLGLGNTPEDPCRVERSGFLGEMALAKLIGGEVNFKYCPFGESVDFIVCDKRDITIDIKTSVEHPQQFCVYSKSAPSDWYPNGREIQIPCDMYVFAYVLNDNRHRAIVRVVGCQTGDYVRGLDDEDAPTSRSNHKNKHIRYDVVLPLLPSIQQWRPCLKKRPVSKIDELFTDAFK